MIYLDDIIRFLSGDMNEEESKAFLEKMESDALLAEEFKNVSEIWQLMEENLRLNDIEEPLTADQLKTEIMAKFDLAVYRDINLSSKEIEFKQKLNSIIGSYRKKKRSSLKDRKNRGLFELTLFIAYAAALVTFMLHPGPETPELVSRYYKPGKYIAELPVNWQSRTTDFDPGYLVFTGKYSEARIEYEKLSYELDPVNKLLYAISCMETDRKDTAIMILYEITEKGAIGYRAKWLLSLSLLQSERYEEAEKILTELTGMRNPYRHKAVKLLRSLE